jgi:hypothetical protein
MAMHRAGRTIREIAVAVKVPKSTVARAVSAAQAATNCRAQVPVAAGGHG